MFQLIDESYDFYDNEEVDKIIRNFGSDSIIMDLGCGVPKFLFEMQLKYNFTNFIGVDIAKSEIELIKRYFYYHEQSEASLFSLKECHKSYMKKYAEKFELSDDRINELNDNFSSGYRIITGFDIAKDNLEELGNADIIILNDVLHFLRFNDVLKVSRKIADLANQNALIALRVNHVENMSFTRSTNSKKAGKRSYKNINTNEVVHLIDESGFKTIIEVLESNQIEPVIQPEKYRNQDGNGFKSMLFVGQRRN